MRKIYDSARKKIAETAFGDELAIKYYRIPDLKSPSVPSIIDREI